MEKTKRFYTIAQLHEELEGIISKGQVYRMVNRGEIPVRKIGNKLVVPAAWVNDFLNAPAVAMKNDNAS